MTSQGYSEVIRPATNEPKEESSSRVDQLESLASLLDPLTQALPTPKQVKTNSQPATPASSTSPANLSMDQYLSICHIEPTDSVTRAVIKNNLLYHWLIFKTTSVRTLCKLGMHYGPAVLLTKGVHEAMKQLNQIS
ncbi:hypothetical protein PTTG_27512 [Puccinia triticina 1-1 BBBD Race 1]|uniref:Uncharacterized protein n=1 Tax=Puccinia triticina (isolate 1-1 / race 1 (BBBD)) TaxID=630390 RepID=A0A180GKJ3_PUCT1|nr:hypothetical protein PTTG_27512 [Puccinia triticina 1-1 BBBD Race 1]